MSNQQDVRLKRALERIKPDIENEASLRAIHGLRSHQQRFVLRGAIMFCPKCGAWYYSTYKQSNICTRLEALNIISPKFLLFRDPQGQTGYHRHSPGSQVSGQ